MVVACAITAQKDA